jgi:hypothetical protein
MHSPIRAAIFTSVFALVFLTPTLADQVILFTQPLADNLQPIGTLNTVPTALDVGLSLCLGCSLDPLTS